MESQQPDCGLAEPLHESDLGPDYSLSVQQNDITF